jgi:zinc transport system ATP-binding protein
MQSDPPRSGAGDELLRCEGLVIGHSGQPLLPPLDLRIQPGMFLAVVGRNGAGKSTWFRTVLGLLPPVSGHVWRAPGACCAYVAQAARLDAMLPLRSRELVRWGRLSGWSFMRPFASRQDHAIADWALESAGAIDLSTATYRELSEGQKQRVLFARMLAADADISFLDEPTASMDAIAERRVMEQLRALAHERRRAIVVVSHVLSLAARYADQVLYLDRDDQLVLIGSPEEVFSHPAFSRQFGATEPSHAR